MDATAVESRHELGAANHGESRRAEWKALHQGHADHCVRRAEYLAGGTSEDQILGEFPDLAREDIRAALAFAAARERRLANSVA